MTRGDLTITFALCGAGNRCSHCRDALDLQALRMWNDSGGWAQFCHRCAMAWFRLLEVRDPFAGSKERIAFFGPRQREWIKK